MIIRPLHSDDLGALKAIQAQAPEAAHWPVHDYLGFVCVVAEDEGEVLGFAAGRQLVRDEAEILNVAVAAAHRRKGLGKMLVEELKNRLQGDIFLEVRASNSRAIALYEGRGFQRAGTRPGYYSHPHEDGIVLRFQPC